MTRRERILADQESRKPRKLLNSDFLLGVYDETRMCFVGNKFKITYSLGDRVWVRVMDACKETREVNFRILGKEINRGK